MKRKYVKVERSDASGSYIVKEEQLIGVFDGEFDGIQDWNVGTKLILTIVEMEPQEFQELPEFMGW